ncbi:hypothetical protein MJ699_15530 [Klebsiella pneumoniae]|nr:hypothetical protein MJ699_15530 [Klebsiella pneumoniae]
MAVKEVYGLVLTWMKSISVLLCGLAVFSASVATTFADEQRSGVARCCCPAIYRGEYGTNNGNEHATRSHYEKFNFKSVLQNGKCMKPITKAKGSISP